MAASAFTLFNKAKREIPAGTFSQDKTFRVILTTNAQALTAAFSGDMAQLTAQVASGNGYTTGGKIMTNVTYSGDAGTVKFDADDVVWDSSTITAKYAVVAVEGKLLGFTDLNTAAPTGMSSTNDNFTVGWDETNGLFTYS